MDSPLFRDIDRRLRASYDNRVVLTDDQYDAVLSAIQTSISSAPRDSQADFMEFIRGLPTGMYTMYAFDADSLQNLPQLQGAYDHLIGRLLDEYHTINGPIETTEEELIELIRPLAAEMERREVGTLIPLLQRSVAARGDEGDWETIIAQFAGQEEDRLKNLSGRDVLRLAGNVEYYMNKFLYNPKHTPTVMEFAELLKLNAPDDVIMEFPFPETILMVLTRLGQSVVLIPEPDQDQTNFNELIAVMDIYAYSVYNDYFTVFSKIFPFLVNSNPSLSERWDPVLREDKPPLYTGPYQDKSVRRVCSEALLFTSNTRMLEFLLTNGLLTAFVGGDPTDMRVLGMVEFIGFDLHYAGPDMDYVLQQTPDIVYGDTIRSRYTADGQEMVEIGHEYDPVEFIRTIAQEIVCSKRSRGVGRREKFRTMSFAILFVLFTNTRGDELLVQPDILDMVFLNDWYMWKFLILLVMAVPLKFLEQRLEPVFRYKYETGRFDGFRLYIPMLTPYNEREYVVPYDSDPINPGEKDFEVSEGVEDGFHYGIRGCTYQTEDAGDDPKRYPENVKCIMKKLRRKYRKKLGGPVLGEAKLEWVIQQKW